MRNPGPDDILNKTEMENLRRLETVAQDGLRTYAEVAEALTEIRDTQLYRGTHATFEAYLRERWDINNALPVRSEGSDAIAEIYRQVVRALESSQLTVADLRLTLHKVPTGSELPSAPNPIPSPVADLSSGELLPQLRWLLTQSAGTVADVAHQVETHPFEVDDRAREQLRDDVLVIEEELGTLKMLLASVDWDAEFQDLLGEENAPPDSDSAAEDE